MAKRADDTPVAAKGAATKTADPAADEEQDGRAGIPTEEEAF